VTQSTEAKEVTDSPPAAAPPPSAAPAPWFPARPRTPEAAGLPASLLRDLILKTLYHTSPLAGFEIGRRLRLDYITFDPLIGELTSAGLIQSTGDARHKPQRLDKVEEGLNYAINETGRERAREALDRCAYVGVAPVPHVQYTISAVRQALPERFATKDRLSEVVAHLVLPEKTLKLLGPALNSRKSIFIYGHTGNGKSSIARATRSLLGGSINIPWAVAVDDQIVRLLDPGHHEPSGEPLDARADQRWMKCKRPFISVGGELDMSMLDLIWHADAKFYDAPLQMKANGGILLVDDFGRQVIEPRALLNRFIVPLEENVDYLNMSASGRKIDVPFSMLLIFSTNLQPAQLVDEAFLRRIRHKLRIPDPDEKAFREIFRREAENNGITYHPSALDYIVDKYYKKADRPMRGVHPRDILMHVREIAAYEGRDNIVLDQQIVDDACEAQFVGEL